MYIRVRDVSVGSCLQDAEMMESVTGARVRSNDDDNDDDEVDDAESEGEETQRHVDFAIEDGDSEGGGESGKPNRLHRRDTPHHLKNKRIHGPIDKEKVASIIAQVSPPPPSPPPLRHSNNKTKQKNNGLSTFIYLLSG